MKPSGNKPLQPFLILLLTCSFLFLISSTDRYLCKYSTDIRHLNLFSEITKSSKKPKQIHTHSHKTHDENTQVAEVHKQIDSLKIIDYGNNGSEGLAKFFEALKNIKTKKKIRIAWFGDSMIEGDLITQDLRYFYQKKFGGAGVGIVPITSVTAGFRQTVQHTFSENWTNKNLLEAKSKSDALGITGFVFKPQTIQTLDTTNFNNKNLSWVKYRGCKKRGLDQFYHSKLFYGPSESDNFVHVDIKDKLNKNYSLTGKKLVNTLDINTESGYGEVTFSFIAHSKLPIYAVSFESDSGVLLDNFSFSGNSGLPLTNITRDVLQGFDQENNYDLIILQYGMNAVSPTATDYHWYESGLDRMVKHIHASFPNASILFIGVPDKGYKENGEYITNPGVPLVVEVEEKVAQQNGIAFWNLYQAMGGENSMVQWADADTALANKDYTHFNFRGANKVANMLYKALDKEYSNYIKSTPNTKKPI